MPDPKSIMEGHSELKIGRKEAHDTCHPRLHLEIEGSKVKVTRPIITIIVIIIERVLLKCY